MKKKIMYWNNIPSPYMVDRFNALADLGVDTIAVFADRVHPNRSWVVDEAEWRFEYKYLRRFRVFGREFRIPPSFRGVDVLISLYDEPVFVVGLIWARLCRVSTFLWCEITIGHWYARRWWKNLIKHLLFRIVTGSLSAGSQGKVYSERFGVSPTNAHILRHVIDAHRFAAVPDELRHETRERIGLRGTVFLYVGHLWDRKGVCFLIDAYRRLEALFGDDEVSLLLVGDGPDEAECRRLAKSCKGVRFTGFIQQSQLPEYFAASDVFVLPSLGDAYGLVVDEALASGLVVVATDAVGEIGDRVTSGINGYVVPAASADALYEVMEALHVDRSSRSKMSFAAKEGMASSSPCRWATELMELVGKL